MRGMTLVCPLTCNLFHIAWRSRLAFMLSWVSSSSSRCAGYGILIIGSRPSHRLCFSFFLWHFSFRMASSAKHCTISLYFLSHSPRERDRLGLGLRRGFIHGSLAGPCISTASFTLYIEAAREKSSLGPGDSGWAAYNRYHITICFSMIVLSPPFSPPLCCDLIGVGTKFI